MELIPNRLYLTLDTSWREDALPSDMFIDLDDLYQHTKVRKHFGPPSLKIIWKHCDEVDAKLKRCKRLIFFTNNLNDNLRIEQRTVSSFLMAAYAVLRLQWDAEKTNRLLLQAISARLAFFRDYHGDSSYKLNIHDCLSGLEKGCLLNGWFTSFVSTKFPQATNGHLDMNWLAPGLLLAFKDPTLRRDKEARGVSRAVLKELKRCGIKAVVRLNGNDHVTNMEYYGRSYNAHDIKQEKLHHYEIPFQDVNVPTSAQVDQFITLCERFGEKIAVHCHAGLGRTATMIGCYLIKHYNFDARSACAWMKMCRRGSVMGPQHFYLDTYQKDYMNSVRYKEETETMTTRRDYSDTVKVKLFRSPSSTQPTRISRPPRKNNVIHVVPVNTRSTRQSNPMQKYKLSPNNDSCDVKRNKAAAPVSVREVKERSLASLMVVSPQANAETNTKELPPRSKKSRMQSRAQVAAKPVHISLSRSASASNEKTKRTLTTKTSTRSQSAGKQEVNKPIKMQRKITRPMSKRVTKSHDTTHCVRTTRSRSNMTGLDSWSQWSEKVMDNIVSQSKSKLYGMINMYSRKSREK